MLDIDRAKERLVGGNYTCVFCKEKEIIVSTYRGVRPLVNFLDNNDNLVGFSAADKVVGRATAFLYLKLGVKSVYAGVISVSALKVLEDNLITVRYGTLVDNIINRTGDGICPFENLVLDVDDVDVACYMIREKLKEMDEKK